MTQETSTAHRPPNPWDGLVGLCFGVQCTCLGLEFADRVGPEVSRWGRLFFLAAIVLQLIRQWHLRPAVQDREEGQVAKSFIHSKQENLDLLLGLFFGVQLTFLALMYADLLRGLITLWGNAAGMIFIALVVLRNRRIQENAGL